jgi:hypothetical protein
LVPVPLVKWNLEFSWGGSFSSGKNKIQVLLPELVVKIRLVMVWFLLTGTGTGGSKSPNKIEKMKTHGVPLTGKKKKNQN